MVLRPVAMEEDWMKTSNYEIVLTGPFGGTIDLDPGTGTHNKTTNSGLNTYVVMLDSNHQFKWGEAIGGGSNIQSRWIRADQHSSVFITGSYDGTIDVDPGTTTHSRTSMGSYDHFLIKLDSSGQYVWDHTFGGSKSDDLENFEINQFGEIYYTGEFEDTVNFATKNAVHNEISNGNTDAFLMKLSHCVADTTVQNRVRCKSYKWIDGNTYYASNDTSTITFENSAGCDSVVRLNLTINNADTVIYSTDTSLASKADFAIFQWLDCDSSFQIISGESDSVFYPGRNGNFALRIINGGCTDTTRCYEIDGFTIDSVPDGLATIDIEEIKVFPNPSNGLIYIELPMETSAQIIVYNASGMEVLRKDVNEQRKEHIELKSAPGPIYP